MKTTFCSALWVGMMAVACGGQEGPAQSAPPPEPEVATGGETAAAVEASAPDPPAEKPASGPATITVAPEVDGKPARAEVQLLQGDAQIASGPSGQPLTVEAGEYTMLVQITDDSLVDNPVQRRSLTLVAGADITETVEFPAAYVQLNVRINGRLDKRARVDVLRDGEVVATLRSGAPHVALSPGRYKAVVKARGREVEVQELMFPQGATRSVPVDVRM